MAEVEKKKKGPGAPKDPHGEIVSNGLYQHQNERLRNMAVSIGLNSAAALQRRIVDMYFAENDAMIQFDKDQQERVENNTDNGEYRQLSMFEKYPLLFANPTNPTK